MGRQPGHVVSPGEVRWIELPALGGHEQAGHRPGVVLQDDAKTPGLPTVLVVPVTSAQLAARFPATMVVEPSAENGLTRASVVLAFQLRAVDRRRIGALLGTLPGPEVSQLVSLVDTLMGAPRVDAGEQAGGAATDS